MQSSSNQQLVPSAHIQANVYRAAAVSKLLKPTDRSRFNTPLKQQYERINKAQISQIVDSNKFRLRDIRNMLELFPDLELLMQIVVSSILSPKDMVSSELIYRTKDDVLPQELTAKLNEMLQGEIDSAYRLTDNLYNIVAEAMFTVGSYMDVVIPESAIDAVINKETRLSNEALGAFYDNPTDPEPRLRSRGILGSPIKQIAKSGFSFEAFRSANRMPSAAESEIKFENQSLYIQVSDNEQLLKFATALEAHQSMSLENLYRPEATRIEDIEDLTNKDFSSVVYKSAGGETETFLVIPTKEQVGRKSIGRPLVMHIPSEAIIPVHVPGNEKEHIGYLIAMEVDGHPVSMKTNQQYLDSANTMDFSKQQSSSSGLAGSLLTKAKHNLQSTDRNNATLDDVSALYTSLVESDLIQRIRNGRYGREVAISKNEELYRIMFARSLAERYTQIIYIPKELATYICFDHFDNGIGKSALDKIKMLSSLRAVTMFSRVVGSAKNSIPVTKVNMTLSEDDPDPEATIETSTHEILKMRQMSFPLGINNGPDLVNWIHRAGLMMTFEGHPGIPETKFEFENVKMDHALPDVDLEESLRKQSYMALSVSPETVDNGFNSEFATTSANNNILFSKRILQWQAILTPYLSEMIKKRAKNDSIIYMKLKKTIIENKTAIQQSLTEEEDKQRYNQNPELFCVRMLETYIDNIDIGLPKPDVTNIRTQFEAFKDYVESLDEALKAWADSTFVTSELVGDASDVIDNIKEVAKAYLVRNWMTDNGFMPELATMFGDIDATDNSEFITENSTHFKRLLQTALRFVKDLKPVAAACNKDMAAMNVDASGGSSDYSSDDSGSSDNSSSGTDDFDMGDFGNLDGDGTDDAGSESEPDSSEEPAPEPEAEST